MDSDKDKHIDGLLPLLKVIHEDNHLLLVFKPHRQLIQSDQLGSPTLFLQICDWLKEKYQKPGKVFLGMVHRLDRPAAGLVVFAKTSKGASRLSEQIRAKEMKKKYQMVVQGEFKNSSGECVHYLSDPESGRSQVFDEPREHTKKAELFYRVLEVKKGLSLVEVDLITGRRHQIRAQMAHLGFPIVGDGRYGASLFFKEGSIALVATQLGFKHPTTREMMSFDLPDELNSAKRFFDEH
ncbi:MAG: RluA family pseudouridine synthase [Pseudomonadota bacterium]